MDYINNRMPSECKTRSTRRVSNVSPSKYKYSGVAGGEGNPASGTNRTHQLNCHTSDTVSVCEIREKHNINSLCKAVSKEVGKMTHYEQGTHREPEKYGKAMLPSSMVRKTAVMNSDSVSLTDSSVGMKQSAAETVCKSNRRHSKAPERKITIKSAPKLCTEKRSIVNMFESIAAEEAIDKKKGEFVRKKSSAVIYKELDDLVQEKKLEIGIEGPKSIISDSVTSPIVSTKTKDATPKDESENPRARKSGDGEPQLSSSKCRYTYNNRIKKTSSNHSENIGKKKEVSTICHTVNRTHGRKTLGRDPNNCVLINCQNGLKDEVAKDRKETASNNSSDFGHDQVKNHVGKNEDSLDCAQSPKSIGEKPLCQNVISKMTSPAKRLPLQADFGDDQVNNHDGKNENSSDCAQSPKSISDKPLCQDMISKRTTQAKRLPLRGSKNVRRFSEQKKGLVNMFESIAREEAEEVKKGRIPRKVSIAKQQQQMTNNNVLNDKNKHLSSTYLTAETEDNTSILCAPDLKGGKNTTVTRLADSSDHTENVSNSNINARLEEVKAYASDPEIDLKKVSKMLASDADTFLALEQDLSRINDELGTVKSDISHILNEVQQKTRLRKNLSVSVPDMMNSSDLIKCHFDEEPDITRKIPQRQISENVHNLQGRCVLSYDDSSVSPCEPGKMCKPKSRVGGTDDTKLSSVKISLKSTDSKQSLTRQEHIMDDDGFHSSSGTESGNIVHKSSYSDCAMIIQDHQEQQYTGHQLSAGVAADCSRKESGELFRLSQNTLKLTTNNQKVEISCEDSSSSEAEADEHHSALRRNKDMVKSEKANSLSRNNSGAQTKHSRSIGRSYLCKEPTNETKARSWVKDWVSNDSVSETPENKIVCWTDLRIQQELTECEQSANSDDNDEANMEHENEKSGRQRSRFISVSQQLEVYEGLRSEGLDIVADQETKDIISDTITACSGESTKKSILSKERLRDASTTEWTDDSDSQPSRHDFEKDAIKRRTSLGCRTAKKSSTEGIDKGRSRRKASVDPILMSKLWSVDNAGTEVVTEDNSTTFSTMFGYFNFCFYNFIANEYGVEEWKKITIGLSLTKKQALLFEKPRHDKFDDILTDKLVRFASVLFSQDLHSFMQKYGTSYFHIGASKYAELLKSIATNLGDFINNMDDVRRHIHKIEKIKERSSPSLHASTDRGGNLLIHHYSNCNHSYMDHFLIGFLQGAAQALFGMHYNACVKQERCSTQEYSLISMKAVACLSRQTSASMQNVSNSCEDLVLEPDVMDDVLPFHIICDHNLEMTQIGVFLNRLIEKHIRVHGFNIKSYFKLVKPAVEFSYDIIKNTVNTAFILASCDGMFKEHFADGLILKGQMTQLPSSTSLWFIVSPKVDRLSDLNELSLGSIPLHDATREVLLIREQSHATDTLKSQLQALTNRLRETSKELALGKINTEALLDEIFPKQVARQLMLNQPVPAVSVQEVTILFTDIVGFTRICSECDPDEITAMLNNLYLEFDMLAEKYDSYKVETIGDAYMAVGGIHRKDKDHGRNTTLMGIEMVERASQVCTPSKENIQIRVGIHTGSVVAGVVGTRMPRYCLFGNNSSLANKMESTSEPLKVHISPSTYLEIKHHQEFVFWYRKRDVMPALMQKHYQGNTFFVTQRSRTMFEDTPRTELDGRTTYPYMKYSHLDEENENISTRMSDDVSS